uniref:dUTPase-like domain-containing protein n=1 Tax=Accipiter nisus TaxID=211598 RepID=A0A8B9NB56_9AVES
ATARGSLPPTPPRYSPYESVVSQLKQYRVTDLRSATSASAGLDLAVATVVLNTPKEIKVVSTGIWGGLPKGLVGILVLTGIIDSDYQGDLKMMIIILFGYHVLQPGQQVAQLLLFPYWVPNSNQVIQGEGNFGSTNDIGKN